MSLKRTAIGLIMGALSAVAQAQSVVGSSIVDGQKVVLFSDQTWNFERATTADCSVISVSLEFCGFTRGWVEITSQPDQDVVVFNAQANTYGIAISENVGSDNGLSSIVMRQAILENAALATGRPNVAIPVLGLEPRTLLGLDGETMFYFVSLNGLEVMFAASVLILPERSIQLISYGFGRQITPDLRVNHQNFIELFKLRDQ